MTRHEIYEIVNMASALRLKEVVVTGGEPFSRPDLIAFLSSAAVDKGLRLHAITSAVWADNKKNTHDMLQRTGPWSKLTVSCDDFHQKHVPIERCINVLKVAKEIGINTSVTTIDSANKVLEDIPSYLRDGVTVFSQPLMGVCEYSWPELDGQCINMAVPYIECGNHIYACCGDLCDLKKDNPLYLGSTRDILSKGVPLEKLLLIKFLRLFGPLSLYKAMVPNALERASHFTSQCMLCHNIFLSPCNLNRVYDYLGREDILAKITIAEAILFSKSKQIPTVQ